MYLHETIIHAYCEYVSEQMFKGWDGYIVTFMYRQLKGAPPAILEQMRHDVERVYATHLTRVVRNPHRHPIEHLPTWVACPDYPVPKHAKASVREVTINGGLHIHAVALQPPESRMAYGLDQHFERMARLYARVGHPLSRVCAKRIEASPERVVTYVFKALLRRNVTLDNILILPRGRSELETRPVAANEASR